MLNYHPRAAKAIGFLKRSYNDIEIFVEDTAHRQMWTRILERILPNHIKLKSVNMLGGRDAVLQACKRDQSSDGRRKLYIIDADLDYLHARRKPKLKHLYRLRAYCIENLIVRDDAILQVAMDSDVGRTRESIERDLSLNAFRRELRGSIGFLFVIYATAQHVAPDIQTIGRGVLNLCRSGSTAELDAVKVKARAKEIVRDGVTRGGLTRWANVRKEIQKRARDLTLDQLVSGKDYILPLLWLRVKTKCRYKGDLDQFKVALAKEYTSSNEPYLSKRLQSICR